MLRHLTRAFPVLLGLVPGLLQAQAAPAVSPLTALSQEFQSIAARVSPAVVEIFIVAYAPPRDPDAPAGYAPDQRGGSGVVIDPAGYLVTNAHVVEDARRVQVMVPRAAADAGRGTRLLDARIVGVDEETDLALLKIDGGPFPALELADSDRLAAGQLVLAFGSPLGLENSVTMGIVSATARQLDPDDPMVYIQTDAPINPGNSGGALVDTEGRLVGINTLIYSQSGGSEGLGFAAPSNIVRAVARQLRALGRVRRGSMGVVAQTITPDLAAGLNLGRDRGVILADVDPAGPAAAAGLRPGDIVIALDGKALESGALLDIGLYGRAPGTAARLTVDRDGASREVVVTVQERAGGAEQLAELAARHPHPVARLGILALDLDPDVAAALDWLRDSSGVVVAAPAIGPGYRMSDLLPGDVIHAVNGRRVRNLAGLNRGLSASPAAGPLVLWIEREGRYVYLVAGRQE